MATTSWFSPGTISSSARTGGAVNWSNPSNAAASDNSYASAALSTNGSHWLWCTNFGLSSSDVPSGSTVIGIEARWEAKQSFEGIGVEGSVNTLIRLIKSSALTGTQKTQSGHLTDADAVYTYGGAADMWGATFSDAEIIASTTGVAFAFEDLDLSTTTVTCDHVQFRVHYTPPSSGRRRAGFF